MSSKLFRIPRSRCCIPAVRNGSYGSQTRRQVRLKASKKEDAAKKALQEMFEGKKDVLSAYDRKPPSGGDGGGGGGGGGFGGFNWGEWFDGFKRWWSGVFSTLATIAAMGAIVFLFTCSGQVVKLIRIFFRLDGPRSIQNAPLAHSEQDKLDIAAGKLSENEANLIAKYGSATDDVYTEESR